MNSKKSYRVFDGLRVATVLTFISGYLNAFTFVTQEGRFAGIQSGNLLLFAYHLSLGNMEQVFHFSIPIFFFIIGQFFTYQTRKWFEQKPYFWHFSSSIIMMFILLITVLITPILPHHVTIACLAFVSSIQVETFRRIRENTYANVMMTGNLKHAAYLWYKGFVEKDKELQEKGIHIFIIILGFLAGVMISTRLSLLMGEYALVFALLPMLYINVTLWYEKKT